MSCSGVLKAGQPKAQGCGESLPCHQPCCTGTGKDWVQESLKTGAAYFFQWDFGGSPARDVILLPSPTPIFSFSVRCLAIALALLFWSADKKNLLFHITCHHHAQDMAQPVEMSHHSQDSTGRQPALPVLGFVDGGSHQGGMASSEHYTSMSSCFS